MAEEPAAPTVWVLGASGLLGGAVVREVRRAGGRALVSSVPWRDPEAAVAALLADADRLPPGAQVAWCAGAGVVATPEAELRSEVDVLADFLARWRPDPRPAAVFLASSAGGVYAGSTAPPFSELSDPAPAAAYGHAKLASERLFEDFAERTGTPLLVGRLANLYGPGQDLSKPQGLVSRLCDGLVRRYTVSLVVSPDTLRDYLYVDDAAAMVVAGLAAVARRGGCHVKILASGDARTIAHVVAEVSRVARRRPPTLVAPAPGAARTQVLDLRLRSAAWPALQHLARTPLPVGIAACLHDADARVRLPDQPPPKGP